MKFKTNVTKDIVHKGTVTCLGWCNNAEIYSVRYLDFIFNYIPLN